VSVTVAGVLSIFSAVGNIIAAPVKSWSERKKITTETKMRVFKAKAEGVIERARTGQLHENEVESLLIEQSGWKDEYWTIVISIPLILCFFPLWSDAVLAGFNVLGQTPLWYQTICGVVILSPFGKRGLSGIKNVMKKGD